MFAAAEVDLADFGVGLYVVEFSFAQDGALVEDGDFAAAGDLFYESHVVLDDDDAVFASEGEEQFPGAMSFVVGHAGSGFVDEENLRVLGEEHTDFEPLFFSVGKLAGEPVAFGVETDEREQLVNALALRGARPVEQRRENAARALEREQEIFPDAVLAVDRGGLKFSADAEAIDLVFGQSGEVGVPAEFDFPRVGLGAAGDEIEERGFARAVGADDGAELAAVEVEIEIRDGLEAVEGLVHALDGEDEVSFFLVGSHGATGAEVAALAAARRAHHVLMRPGTLTMPPGSKRTTMMNMPPRKKSQRSG